MLNGAPPALGLLGIDALAEMMCDWSVAILEETINDPSRRYRVRRYAMASLGELLVSAIDRGYSGTSQEECHGLLTVAGVELEAQKEESHPSKIPAVEDLCDHLSQAVADGVFGTLADF